MPEERRWGGVRLRRREDEAHGAENAPGVVRVGVAQQVARRGGGGGHGDGHGGGERRCESDWAVKKGRGRMEDRMEVPHLGLVYLSGISTPEECGDI
jgi:hypothetical protein